MVKKTGKLPAGKFDSRFVLPVYSTLHVGKQEFKKLEFFIGYKVEKISLDSNNHRKAKVLVKVLTGKNKGFVYSGKIGYGFYDYYLSFDKYKTRAIFKNISDFITYLEPAEKEKVELESQVDCKELSAIVYSQNTQVEDAMLKERSKLMQKMAEEQSKKDAKQKEIEKWTTENNKIFE